MDIFKNDYLHHNKTIYTGDAESNGRSIKEFNYGTDEKSTPFK